MLVPRWAGAGPRQIADGAAAAGQVRTVACTVCCGGRAEVLTGQSWARGRVGVAGRVQQKQRQVEGGGAMHPGGTWWQRPTRHKRGRLRRQTSTCRSAPAVGVGGERSRSGVEASAGAGCSGAAGQAAGAQGLLEHRPFLAHPLPPPFTTTSLTRMDCWCGSCTPPPGTGTPPTALPAAAIRSPLLPPAPVAAASSACCCTLVPMR